MSLPLPLPLGLTLEREHDISAPVEKIMIDHLSNKYNVYGKKGDKITLLLKLSSRKDVLLEYMTHYPTFAADTNTLFNFDRKALNKMSNPDLSHLYLLVGELISSFSDEKRISLPNDSEFKKNMKEIEGHYLAVYAEAEFNLEEDLKSCKVRMSPFDITRQYCDGEGFLPTDTAYRICVLCKHDLVDEPVQNKSIVLDNRKTQLNYVARLNEYNANNTGNNNKKNAPRRPTPKDIIYHCHCKQNSCINLVTGHGCIKCEKCGSAIVMDPITGLSKCEICACECQVAYKKRAYALMTTIQNMKRVSDASSNNGAAIVPTAFGVAPGLAIASLAQHAVLEAFTAQEAVVAGRGGRSHRSDYAVLHDNVHMSLGRGIGIDQTADWEMNRTAFGDTTMMTFGNRIVDASKLGTDDLHKYNNRLLNTARSNSDDDDDDEVVVIDRPNNNNNNKRSGHIMAAGGPRIVQPPLQAVAAAAAAALPSSITPTQNNKKKRKNKVSGVTNASPYTSMPMQPTDGGQQLPPGLAGFLNVSRQWHGIATEQGNNVPIRVPSSRFARHVESVRSQPSNIPPTNNALQWVARGSNVAAAPTATATATTPPVTRLVRDLKTKVIRKSQPVYDIEHDRYDTPDSGAQANARFLYNGELPNDLLEDTARAVIENKPDATGTDVAIAIGHLGMGFPRPITSRRAVVVSSKKKKGTGQLKDDNNS